MIKLVKPSIEFKLSFINMINDYKRNNEKKYTSDYFTINFNFEEYLRDKEKAEKGLELPQGCVPTTEWWLINENIEIIGTVRLRHRLGEDNKYEGGHIGYDISPRFRRRGFGTKILELALEEAKKFGIEKVLVTCDADNIGSMKIIKSNNGIFEKEAISADSGKIFHRYWITI